jgi:predicted nucleic acid-binding protein
VKNFLEAQAKYEIQVKIKNGEILLVWSYILSYENSVNPFPEVRYQIEGWKQYAVEEITETPDIIHLSIRFQKIGLKSKDALHIACAIQGKCHSFITTDKRILNKSASIDGIGIVSPLQFIDSEE